MKSMTGYGKGVAEANDRKVTIEMKAVNHRFLDLLFKLPRNLSFLEDGFRKTVQNEVSRGHIDVYCNYEDNREGKSVIKVDGVIAAMYKEIGKQLESIGYINDITASQIIKFPEVLTVTGIEDNEEIIRELAEKALAEALKKLTEMRTTEGNMLTEDFIKKLKTIEELLSEITERAPLVGEEYKTKLRTRINESLAGIDLDEARLLNEVAFFTDKASIDEEITRLSGHITHGYGILKEKEAVGKKLDFLVQEMNREVNTIGSKSNDLFITRRVLLLKGEIEKIREQVQNIE